MKYMVTLMDIKNTKKILVALFVFGMVVMPVVGFGQTSGGGNNTGTTPTQVKNSNINFTLPNPFKGGSDLMSIITTIFDNIILPLGSVLIVLVIIFSGFKFLTAQGKPADLATARQALLYAVIGAAILLGAKGISEVIEKTICSDLFKC